MTRIQKNFSSKKANAERSLKENTVAWKRTCSQAYMLFNNCYKHISVRHSKAKQHRTAHLYIPVVLLQQLSASVNVINTCQLLQQSSINK